MDTPKYTPGPWKTGTAGDPTGDIGSGIFTKKGKRQQIGTCHCGTNFSNWDHEVARANALLCAAAPEMLELLERLDSNPDGVSCAEMHAVIRKARGDV